MSTSIQVKENDLHFYLHPKQGEVYLSKATEILFGGAAGPGKSHLLRVAAILWAWLIPGLQIHLFRRTHPEVVENHLEGPSSFPSMLAHLMAAGAVKWVKDEFRFANGSRIALQHCQHEKDVFRFAGPEFHVLMIDELTTFTETQYRWLRSRLRKVGLKLPDWAKGLFPRILAGTNPGQVGHNWVRAMFVDSAPRGTIHKMTPKEGGLYRQFIPALYNDNPSLLEDDPDYIDRLEGLGNPALVSALKRGDWNIIAGGFLDDVWDHQIHVLKPFKLPESWYLNRSFDWGSSRPFSVGWWAKTNGERPDDPTVPNFAPGTMIRFDEWYGYNGKPNEGIRLTNAEIGRGIKQRENEMGMNGRIQPGPADPSIWDGSRGLSIHADIAKQGITFTPGNAKPGSRVAGGATVRAMLKNSMAWPREKPGIFVFNNCIEFIRTVPVICRDSKKTDDVDTNSEDHIYDEMRYEVHKDSTVADQVPFSH